ncbi:MAG TPA: T9SS type A sorting domain-containing protein [Candidatus Sulfotelmatobacter sp.]|nr:T9SS type A sorting domain-containing protein [Candidatus Sulfotelmatobacter sp.]
MRRQAMVLAAALVSLFGLPSFARAATPPARDPQYVRFMGREFPRQGTDARRAWIARLQSRVATARTRLAAAKSGASMPNPDQGGLPSIESWTGNGEPVVTSPIGQAEPTGVADGSGGAIFAFEDFRSGAPDVFASHLDSNGNFVSGWDPAGFPVAVTDSFEVLVQSCTDGAGGMYVSWSVLHTGSGSIGDLYLQRITSAGALSPGWPVNGRRYAVGELQGYALRADGSNGTYVGWTDMNLQPWVVRLDGSGNAIAGWPGGGKAIGNANNQEIDFTLDGSGGFLFTWASNDSVFATRLAGDGTFSPGWNANGVLICTGSLTKFSPAITRLSTGNFMLAWTDDRNFDLDIFAQCITPSGTIPSPWPLNGVQLCGAAGLQDGTRLVPDLSGGAVAVWQDYRGAGTTNTFYAQHVTSTGAIAAGWAADGNLLCDAATSKGEFLALPDNAGGVDVVWVDNRAGNPDVYVQRMLSGGSRPPGFPSGGAAIVNTPDDQDTPCAVTDGTNGVISAWDDARGGLRVYAGKILGDGTVSAEASLVSASAEPGRVLLRWFSPNGANFVATLERDANGSGYATLATVRADGTGNVSYEDDAVTAGASYAYRLRVMENGAWRTLGEVRVRVPQTLALSFGALRPNPSAGPLTTEFTLPGAQAAKLELLDVQGRRVLSREVTLGAGTHVVRLEESAALKAGVYVLRLTQGGRSIQTRAVIAR